MGQDRSRKHCDRPAMARSPFLLHFPHDLARCRSALHEDLPALRAVILLHLEQRRAGPSDRRRAGSLLHLRYDPGPVRTPAGSARGQSTHHGRDLPRRGAGLSRCGMPRREIRCHSLPSASAGPCARGLSRLEALAVDDSHRVRGTRSVQSGAAMRAPPTSVFSSVREVSQKAALQDRTRSSDSPECHNARHLAS